jgi:hypothetical protein
VVPDGTIVDAGKFAELTLNALPLHVVACWLGITGLGFTVTVTVNVLPGQLPKANEVLGVTV